MGDLPPLLVKLKYFSETFSEEEIGAILAESNSDTSNEINFEEFLRVSQCSSSAFSVCPCAVFFPNLKCRNRGLYV